ncbi:uroporphyrinogen-III synthase [Helicobacter sp. MIT 14-3879]|uniref:uroporphyrinogen-III synthase n=1 Tax=Helicobacter sp. MIT 14-3879 TaxID=2040649 RepID=UPI000E1E8054|nr:uroporphyrinogen-III synthase [Helicobacter sp. MIT 14-3879]RDU61402.1 hypothetical protein CQA44_09060 [Helicobacter sp. MIT 14-3879]
MIYILKSDNDPIATQDSLLHHDNVHLLSLLAIQFHDFEINPEEINKTDYLLFTSKNALKAVINHPCFTALHAKPAFFIGEESKRIWLEKGGTHALSPKDLQDGECVSGEQFAKLIAPLATGKQILYIRGKDKATDFSKILCDSFIQEVIVYSSVESVTPQLHNTESQSMPISPNDTFADESIFIFGSPKHYRTFCKYYRWNPSWLAISLGDTTFKSFDEDIRKLNARGNFQKALQAAQALCNTTPLQHSLSADNTSH